MAMFPNVLPLFRDGGDVHICNIVVYTYFVMSFLFTNHVPMYWNKLTILLFSLQSDMQ